MKLFQWRGRTSKKEFRKRFIELMQDAAPQVKCVPSAQDDLDLKTEGLDGKCTSGTISLHRAYDEFVKDPADRDEILGRWVNLQSQLSDPAPASREDIMPVIKDRAWLRVYYAMYDQGPPEPGSGRDALYDDINSELIVTYATSTAGSILFLHVSALDDFGLTREGLRALALQNLRRRMSGRAVQLEGDVWAIWNRGCANSALLIDEETWQHPQLDQLDPLIVAAPEREYLLAATGDSPGEILHFAWMASELSRDASYPITPQLMIRREGRLDLLEPCAQDDAHPIPDLDVIDVTNTSSKDGQEIKAVGIVVASPLGADPRSVYRLYRKFDVCLADLGCYARPATARPEGLKPMIYLSIHADSHPEVLEQMDWFDELVSKHGVTLKITIKERNE